MLEKRVQQEMVKKTVVAPDRTTRSKRKVHPTPVL